jgi:hypothetical protein
VSEETVPPDELELDELELLEEEEELLELLELELLDELDELEDELELLELELLDDELEELELLPVPPLQLPAVAFTPVMLRLSTFARPALLVASRRMRLLPATRFTVTEAEAPQVVHAPVLSNAKLPTVAPFTIKAPDRAVEPLAYTKLMA